MNNLKKIMDLSFLSIFDGNFYFLSIGIFMVFFCVMNEIYNKRNKFIKVNFFNI